MGIAERKEREKEKRRNDIIYAAEEIFFSKGIESATMDEIAEKAELSKGTLYLYFRNKEELYIAVVLRSLRILRSLIEEETAGHERGIDRVLAIGKAYVRFFREHPDYFNAMLYYESKEIDDQDESPYTIECYNEGDRTLNVLIEALRKGIEDKSIRADIDPFKTAFILWGQITGLLQIVSIKRKILEDFYQINAEELISYYFSLKDDFLRLR